MLLHWLTQPSLKPAVKALYGLVINDHNYIIFYPWWSSMCLKNAHTWPFYDLTRIGTDQLGKRTRAAGVQPA